MIEDISSLYEWDYGRKFVLDENTLVIEEQDIQANEYNGTTFSFYRITSGQPVLYKTITLETAFTQKANGGILLTAGVIILGIYLFFYKHKGLIAYILPPSVFLVLFVGFLLIEPLVMWLFTAINYEAIRPLIIK